MQLNTWGRSVMLGVALFAAACSAPAATPVPAPPPTAPPTAQTQAQSQAAKPAVAPLSAPNPKPANPVNLRYGPCCSISWTQSVAEARGYYADENLSVDVVLLAASANACQNLVAKAIEIGGCSLNDMIQAVEAGANIEQVGSLSYSASNYSLMAKPTIKTWADLKGKVIMVGGPQDNTVYFTRVMARANGLQDADYDFQFAGASSARFAALKSGAVDASLLTDPFDNQASKDGYNTVDVLIPKYVTRDTYSGGGPTVRVDWAKDNADAVKRFLRAQIRANQWINDPANKDALYEIVNAVNKVDRETFDNSYARNTLDVQQYSTDGRFSESGVSGVINSLADLGFLKAPLPPATKFYDNSFVDALRSGS